MKNNQFGLVCSIYKKYESIADYYFESYLQITTSNPIRNSEEFSRSAMCMLKSTFEIMTDSHYK